MQAFWNICTPLSIPSNPSWLMDEEYAHKINLIEYVLSVEHPGVPEPSEAQLTSWTEEQLRAYYRAGTLQPSPSTPSNLPGLPGQFLYLSYEPAWAIRLACMN